MITIQGLQEKGLFEKNPLFNVIINSDGDFKYPPHWHNAIELVYACDGGLKVIVNEKPYVLEEKEMLIIAGGDVHSIDSHFRDGKKIYIQFDAQIFKDLCEREFLKPFIYNTRKYSFHEALSVQTLDEHLDAVAEAYDKKELGYTLLINARIYDVFHMLMKSFFGKIDQGIKGLGNNKLYGMSKLNTAFEYIEKNVQKHISLSDVSKAAGFCESHFSKIFKEVYGKNFHVYLNEYRIRNTEKLLMNENLTITQAALSSGFNSIVTFNRIFKEIKGCTPSAYRRMKVE